MSLSSARLVRRPTAACSAPPCRMPENSLKPRSWTTSGRVSYRGLLLRERSLEAKELFMMDSGKLHQESVRSKRIADIANRVCFANESVPGEKSHAQYQTRLYLA